MGRMPGDAEQLGRFRPYLLFLARMSWDRRLQPKLDPSDLVQQTLLQAHGKLNQFQGNTDEELAGWLRQILANVLAERQRHFHRDKRDVARERSLEDVLAESSRRLSGFPGAEPSPSENVEFGERALRVTAAMERLPEDQRDTLILHYWQGHSVPEIAEFMQRTPSAVGSMVHRGLEKLRDELVDLA